MSNNTLYVSYVKCRKMNCILQFNSGSFSNSCIKLLSMITFLSSENLVVLFYTKNYRIRSPSSCAYAIDFLKPTCKTLHLCMLIFPTLKHMVV